MIVTGREPLSSARVKDELFAPTSTLAWCVVKQKQKFNFVITPSQEVTVNIRGSTSGFKPLCRDWIC